MDYGCVYVGGTLLYRTLPCRKSEDSSKVVEVFGLRWNDLTPGHVNLVILVMIMIIVDLKYLMLCQT